MAREQLCRTPDFSFNSALTATAPDSLHGRFCKRVLSLATRPYWGAIMDIKTALGAIESKQSSEAVRGQAKSADVKTSAEELAALLRRMSEASTREIEELTNQLQRLRTQLQNAGDRIQRDIAQYTELSQQTMGLSSIIVDSVRKLPQGSGSFDK
jgi:predicted transcriptional regulator